MITDKIITSDFLDENLIKIIPSIIVLDQDMRIKSISQEVAKLLYYQVEEILGVDIMDLLHPTDHSFYDSLNELKVQGHFEIRKVSLRNKYYREVLVEISGFYLGLLTDSSNAIVLSIKDIDKLNTYQNLFNDKVAEFNELVYRTQHDLKGPVATIQGLLNIVKYNKTEHDNELTFKQIQSETDKLSARLSNISAIFNSYYFFNLETEDINLTSALIALQKQVNSQFLNQNVKFRLNIKEAVTDELSNELIRNIFNNIILSLKDSDVVRDEANITGWFNDLYEATQVRCKITGIKADFDNFEKIMNHEVNFSDIINNERLLRIYILKNLVHKYNGSIYTHARKDDKWEINIIIPKLR